jgi:3-oxoacyl-[acyl-carrier-protein] synthase-1
MTPLAITSLTTINALGHGLAATAEALWSNRCALRPCDFVDAKLDTYIGRVSGVEDRPVERRLAAYDCRNNRLAQMALRADGFADAVARAIERYGAGRIAVILGTSTSGIREGEIAFAHRDQKTGLLPPNFRFAETHDHHALAAFTQEYLGLLGPALTISTACSSSAKVFADAAQMIEAGVCDAAVVGGADSLCLLILYGFNSLELLDTAPCRPNDAARAGISIGEAAGFALLERANSREGDAAAMVLGYGESADAHHMSAPHPDGLGAELSMRAALDRAGIAPGQVDYINQHGTGSRQNDRAEDAAIARVFGDGMRCGSTKGASGHTLGAAGILEIAICCLAMRDGIVPGNVGLETRPADFHGRIECNPERRPLSHVLNNSFGFGGSNCSILLGSAA